MRVTADVRTAKDQTPYSTSLLALRVGAVFFVEYSPKPAKQPQPPARKA